MRFRSSTLILWLLVISALPSCARRGTIMGGAKDTIPPTLRTSIPKNYSTGFDGNEIRLVFDEYVKLRDVNKQLIVSPPMKTPPEIFPMTASRQITIKFNDTLHPNTTYSLNFGRSIEDNNEGNPYPEFKYVFSTGSHLDSLTLSGTVKDALEREPDTYVSVMLYEAEKLTDSTIYKEPPRYITNTLDKSVGFTLENLKEGKYLLVALKDANGNNRFDPATDKIAFHKEFVSIPNDTLYEMELFREEQPFRAVKAAQDNGSKIVLGYQGSPIIPEVTLKHGDDELSTIISRVPDKDSLHIWFRSTKVDSLSMLVKNGDWEKNFTVKLKNQKTDSLRLSVPSGTIHLRDTLSIKTNTPIESIQNELISIVNKDSVAVPFTSAIDNLNLRLKFEFNREPVERYKMRFLPGAVKDMFGRRNDTIDVSFGTKNSSDYGNLRLTLQNVRRFPVILQLTDEKGKLMHSRIVTSYTPVDFLMIDPMKYIIRVIYDENANGKWDSGNFLEKRQPEEVIYFSQPVDVRANWDVDQVFILR